MGVLAYLTAYTPMFNDDATCSITASEAEVCSWLESLGLGEHCPAFTRNHVDGEALRELASDHTLLRTEVGMHSFGHR